MTHRGHFIGVLQLQELAGREGRWFCLLSDLTYVDVDPQTAEERARWTAPAGTLTDFASIPRALWAVFPPHGKHTRAAVIHDYFCQRGRAGTSPRSSRDVHDLFKRMLEACHCSWVTVRAMWQAVRKFGPRFDGQPLDVRDLSGHVMYDP